MHHAATIAAIALVLVAGCNAGPKAAPGGAAPAMTQAPAADLTSLVGSLWLAEDIGGGGVIDNLQTKLQFVATDRVAGHAGCNSFNGAATLSGAALSFGPFATTRMMCAPAVMDQEGKFIRALESARTARLENDLLILMDESGTPVLRFSRMP
jgi:heat shock protein HslJ